LKNKLRHLRRIPVTPKPPNHPLNIISLSIRRASTSPAVTQPLSKVFMHFSAFCHDVSGNEDERPKRQQDAKYSIPPNYPMTLSPTSGGCCRCQLQCISSNSSNTLRKIWSFGTSFETYLLSETVFLCNLMLELYYPSVLLDILNYITRVSSFKMVGSGVLIVTHIKHIW